MKTLEEKAEEFFLKREDFKNKTEVDTSYITLYKDIIKDFNEWVNIEDEKPTYYSPVIVMIDCDDKLALVWRANDGENDIYTIFGTSFILSDKIIKWKRINL